MGRSGASGGRRPPSGGLTLRNGEAFIWSLVVIPAGSVRILLSEWTSCGGWWTSCGRSSLQRIITKSHIPWHSIPETYPSGCGTSCCCSSRPWRRSLEKNDIVINFIDISQLTKMTYSGGRSWRKVLLRWGSTPGSGSCRRPWSGG